MLRLDDRKALAVKYWCRGTFQDPIGLAVLREVCNLGTAADVAYRRKKEVLHDRPQHNARTETLRLRACDGRKFSGGEFALRTRNAIFSGVRPLYRRTFAVIGVPE